MKIFLLLFSFFALAGQKVPYTPSQKECFTGAAAPYKYCVHIPADGRVNGKVAYLLHGQKLDENTWNDDTFYTAQVQQYWTEHQLVPPTVVTISFGPFWLLAPKGKAAQSGLLEVFTNVVIPEVEARVGKPTARIVFGESMGGVNTLELAFQHGELFERAAALCPPVYTDSPFASPEDQQKFIDRTGANPEKIAEILAMAPYFFADDREWNAFSAVKLVETARAGPEIYMSCGLYDQFGAFEGASLVAERAQARGLPLTWRPLYGGHCAVDVESLAEFLVK